MSWIPGWESVTGARWWENFYFWASIGALILLGAAEIVSHRYTERKDELAAIEQTSTQRRHDEEMARLHAETEASKAEIAKANASAAEANARAEALRLQLLIEQQRRAPRTLTDEQKIAMINGLRGKIESITFVTQRDLESEFFSIQLQVIFQEAGLRISVAKLPAGVLLSAPAGVLMHKPGDNSEVSLKDDPLYLALNAAKLYGGNTAKPFATLELSADTPLLPDGYIIYVGQKPPY